MVLRDDDTRKQGLRSVVGVSKRLEVRGAAPRVGPPMSSLPPSRPSVTKPAPDDAHESSLVLRFGTGMGAGLLGTLLAVLPAARRLSGSLPEGVGPLGASVALAAVALVPMVLVVFLSRRARVGLRAFSGPGRSSRAVAASAYALVLLIFLALMGQVLKATTHHHALAGATFALVGLGFAAVLSVVAMRGAVFFEGCPPRTRRVLLYGSSVVLVLLAAGALLGVGRALASSPPMPRPAAAMILDLLAFGIGVSVAGHRGFADRRLVAFVGPPLAVALFVLGVVTLRGAPPLQTALADQVPLYAAIVGLLTGS